MVAWFPAFSCIIQFLITVTVEGGLGVNGSSEYPHQLVMIEQTSGGWRPVVICPTYLGSSCDGPVPHAAGLWHYSISACALHWSSCESLRKLCTNRCMAYVSLPSTTLPKQPAGCGLRDYEFPRDKAPGS